MLGQIPLATMTVVLMMAVSERELRAAGAEKRFLKETWESRHYGHLFFFAFSLPLLFLGMLSKATGESEEGTLISWIPRIFGQGSLDWDLCFP